MAKLFLRVDLGAERLLGHGKVRLLAFIGELGSISAAGRAMGMSHRCAWRLVEQTNRCFRELAVRARPGGRAGGGAELTALGRDIVARYRAIEQDAQRAASPHLAALEAVHADGSAATLSGSGHDAISPPATARRGITSALGCGSKSRATSVESQPTCNVEIRFHSDESACLQGSVRLNNGG